MAGKHGNIKVSSVCYTINSQSNIRLYRLLLLLFFAILLPGCHPAFSGEPKLIQAIAQNQPKRVHQLLINGANANLKLKNGTTPLIVAATVGNMAITQDLLHYGAKILTANQDGVTPLIAAGGSGNGDTALYLIKQGANPCAVDNKGFDAYQSALNWGNHQSAKKLLSWHKKCNHKMRKIT